MNPQDLLDQYLDQQHVMQLATLNGGQPWICTVYFIAGESHDLYWASLPSRRHSQDIAAHPKVAAAIVVNSAIGQDVVGVQVEGEAQMLEPKAYDPAIVGRYAKRFRRGEEWATDFLAGNTQHRLYRLRPSAMYLFDEMNLTRGKRQQVL